MQILRGGQRNIQLRNDRFRHDTLLVCCRLDACAFESIWSLIHLSILPPGVYKRWRVMARTLLAAHGSGRSSTNLQGSLSHLHGDDVSLYHSNHPPHVVMLARIWRNLRGTAVLTVVETTVVAVDDDPLAPKPLCEVDFRLESHGVFGRRRRRKITF